MTTRSFFKNIILTAIILSAGAARLDASAKRPAGEKMLVARRVPPPKYSKSAADMNVTFIDVGQGNAVFIQSPSGVNILYDAGGNPEWSESSWDPGTKIVIPFLQELNIGDIDYAVISHAHGDHIGGFLPVLDNFKAGVFFDPGYKHPTDLYKNLLEKMGETKSKYAFLKEGDGKKIELGPDIEVEIFFPPVKDFLQATNSDCNNSSVVMKMKYLNVAVLLTGDIEEEGEHWCVSKYGDRLEANILQVPHHGSHTSSSRPFLEKVSPEVAVIPVGKNNTFGHPRPEPLLNLKAVGAEIFRTDYDGNVTIVTNGRTFIVETEK